MGRRLSAARSIGGMASVVITAVATIMVNRLSLSRPMDRPMVAMITSVEPRAFMEQPSASASARPESPDGRAEEGAAELADAGDGDQPDGQGQKVGLGQDREIGGEPRHAEEDRREEAEDQPAELLVDMLGEEGRFADQHPGDEGAQHRLDADEIGDQRHGAGDQQDDADDRGLAAQVVVGPADELVDQPRGPRSG